MTMTINEPDLIENHRTITENIAALRAERSKIGSELRSAGIEADERIKAGLELELREAQQAEGTLLSTLATAEQHKAGLDKRIDAGDDSVTPLQRVP